MPELLPFVLISYRPLRSRAGAEPAPSHPKQRPGYTPPEPAGHRARTNSHSSGQQNVIGSRALKKSFVLAAESEPPSGEGDARSAPRPLETGGKGRRNKVNRMERREGYPSRSPGGEA